MVTSPCFGSSIPTKVSFCFLFLPSTEIGLILAWICKLQKQGHSELNILISGKILFSAHLLHFHAWYIGGVKSYQISLTRSVLNTRGSLFSFKSPTSPVTKPLSSCVIFTLLQNAKPLVRENIEIIELDSHAVVNRPARFSNWTVLQRFIYFIFQFFFFFWQQQTDDRVWHRWLALVLLLFFIFHLKKF